MIDILNATTLRTLIKQANELELSKEDIISIQQTQGQFYLVYCKRIIL